MNIVGKPTERYDRNQSTACLRPIRHSDEMGSCGWVSASGVQASVLDEIRSAVAPRSPAGRDPCRDKFRDSNSRRSSSDGRELTAPVSRLEGQSGGRKWGGSQMVASRRMQRRRSRPGHNCADKPHYVKLSTTRGPGESTVCPVRLAWAMTTDAHQLNLRFHVLADTGGDAPYSDSTRDSFPCRYRYVVSATSAE